MKLIPSAHNYFHWTDAYKELEEVAFKILDGALDPNGHAPDDVVAEVESAVERLYAQHKGEPAWDEAYRRWHEWDDETKDPEAYEL